MRIMAVNFSRRQGGWSCLIAFCFTTAHQFTDEATAFESDVHRWWIAAWWSVRRQVRRHVAEHGAKRGERKAIGWSE